MRYEDMTQREKQLSRLYFCPFCKGKIQKIDDVQIVKIKYGKQILYRFMHTSCLINSILPSQLEGEKYEEVK